MANAVSRAARVLERVALLREIEDPCEIPKMAALSKRLERRLYWELADRASNITHSRKEWWVTEDQLRRAMVDARIARLSNKRHKWGADERREPGVVDHEYTEAELARIWEAEARVDLMRLKRVRMSAEYEEARSTLWPALREEHVKRLEVQAEILQEPSTG